MTMRREQLMRQGNSFVALQPTLNIDFTNLFNTPLPSNFTFTRATTATVQDFEGLIKSCLSGELRIQGARRVRNWLTYTEDFSNAAWTTVTSGTGTCAKTPNYTTAPDGTLTACRVLATKGSGFGVLKQSSISGQSNPYTEVHSVWAISNTGSSQVVSFSDTSGSYQTLTIGTTWQRYALPAGTVAATSGAFEIGAASSSDASVDISIWHPQHEVVTGQANQNPSEYVSVGVLSSPFHGYFADGVKYFNYQNGNTVSSNVVTEAQGAALTGTIGDLAEGARTNLCLYSQDLTNAAWAKAGASVVANQGPSSMSYMDSLVEDSATSLHYAYTNAAVITGAGTYTFSVDVKAGTRNFLQLAFNDYGGGGVGSGTCAFNASTGAVGSASLCTGRLVETLADGVYRFSITFTTASTTANVQVRLCDFDNNSSYTGNGTGNILWANMQVEAGAFASSRQPTTTAAVARNGDVLSAPSAGILNSAAMTIAIRWAPTAASQGTVFLFGTYVDANNYTAILHDGTNIIARKRIGGANHDATKALAYTKDTVYRITARFDGTNGCDIWVDGVKGTNDSTTTAAQVGTNFQMGCDGNSANHSFAVIPTLKAYRSGLSDAQAAAL